MRLEGAARRITIFIGESDRYRHKPLYAEIVPRTFSIVVRPGSRLNQIRFRRGVAQLPAIELAQHHAGGHLLDGANYAGAIRDNLLGVTIHLEGESTDSLIGWRARRHTDRIDLDRVGHYEPLAFWEPIHRSSNSTFILDPDAFYILATREKVRIPPQLTGEMIAYDTQVGEQGTALSAGQAQRVALARALYGDPFLLVLDEPNSNLDTEGDEALTRAIRAARERGAIVVVVAHRPIGIESVDQLLVLKDGRVQAFGPKETVLAQVLQPRVTSPSPIKIVSEGGIAKP